VPCGASLIGITASLPVKLPSVRPQHRGTVKRRLRILAYFASWPMWRRTVSGRPVVGGQRSPAVGECPKHAGFLPHRSRDAQKCREGTPVSGDAQISVPATVLAEAFNGDSTGSPWARGSLGAVSEHWNRRWRLAGKGMQTPRIYAVSLLARVYLPRRLVVHP
jgi:hypothetical protein